MDTAVEKCGKEFWRVEVGGQRLEVRREEKPAPLQRQQECGTPLFASRPRWKLGLRTTFGALRKSSSSLIDNSGVVNKLRPQQYSWKAE